ncbi:methyl-accepting chemotaxis protein [Vibrio sp. MarTm2]|uniref:methyl-accepting chemotaxis protein n=1 Tax=Vibrio sp. MarTm2 TaxID=2998831 RepID=UPI003FCD6885
MPSQAAEVAKEATSQAQSGSQVVGSAGEQGRGFAVVADEVRKLASLSADSTEEIQGVLDRLQGESNRAVSAMVNGRDQSLLVVTSAAEANESLHQIEQHITHISDQNIQVATATEEQSSVVGEINRNVEEINQFTGETVRSLNN